MKAVAWYIDPNDTKNRNTSNLYLSGIKEMQNFHYRYLDGFHKMVIPVQHWNILAYCAMPSMIFIQEIRISKVEQFSQVIVVNALLAAKKESLHVNSTEHLRLMRGAAEAAGAALGNFVGIQRRFERIGTIQGCDIVDDYAHHPTEIRAVLQAARQCFDQQPIWVVFQPHTVRCVLFSFWVIV